MDLWVWIFTADGSKIGRKWHKSRRDPQSLALERHINETHTQRHTMKCVIFYNNPLHESEGDPLAADYSRDQTDYGWYLSTSWLGWSVPAEEGNQAVRPKINANGSTIEAHLSKKPRRG